MIETFPDTFERFRVEDGTLADAYDALPAEERARLKTSQALVSALLGESRVPREVLTASPVTGYAIRRRSTAAAWALFVIGRGADPAMLCALLSAARFAGVDDAIMVFLDVPRRPACHVAADLCGIEHLFMMDEADAVRFARWLRSTGRGRLVLADAPDRWILEAHAIDLPFYDARHAVKARLTGPGLRGCALPADLPPDFFTETTVTIHELH